MACIWMICEYLLDYREKYDAHTSHHEQEFIKNDRAMMTSGTLAAACRKYIFDRYGDISYHVLPPGNESLEAILCLYSLGCLCVKHDLVTIEYLFRHGTKQILTQIGRFWTVTPVWIHQWLRNYAQSLKYHMRGALLFCKVIRQISRSHGTKKTHRIWP